MRMIALAAVLFVVGVSAVWDGASSSAALSYAGYGGVTSISCPAAGECAAGGSYSRGQYREAFVISETSGVWGDAIEVPGTATVNTGGDARVIAISCVAAGECAAGGYYRDRHSRVHGFVVDETSGTWGHAIQVPGIETPAFRASLGAPGISSISCAAAGECAAGNYYVDSSHAFRAFVLSETSGTWGQAVTVQGNVTHAGGPITGVNSISCAAPGECTAGGYATTSDRRKAFVVNETNGTWGNAIQVPGMSTLNAGGGAGVNSVSCTAAGECAADGYTSDKDNNGLAFLVSETNGSWGNAVEVPGIEALDSGAGSGEGDVYDDAFAIACAATGECAAGGRYAYGRPFLANEKSGSWDDAIEVPDIETLDGGGTAEVDSISCAAAGECVAGGQYQKDAGDYHAFLVTETNGIWGNAIEVPGTATPGHGRFTDVNSISCAAAGQCAAGGSLAGYDRPKAFVANETNGSWADASLLSNFPVSCVVPNVVGKVIGSAKTTLRAADCEPGTIKHAYSKFKKGRVIAQKPTPGTSLGPAAKVALTVSRGRRS